tara:strand:- start:129 stop:848 length:720 start_codon:yes stop_codon:yes gene_type:complete
MKDKYLSSTISNYRNQEKESLNSYLKQLKDYKNSPEIILYNFARFVRSQEITKLMVFNELFKKIINIQGSIVEFGIHNGNTLFTLGHLSEIFEHRNYSRQIIGVDPLKDYSLPNGKTIGYDSKNKLNKSIELFNKSCIFNQFSKIKLIQKSFIKGCSEIVEKDDFICSMLIMHIGLYKEEKYILNSLFDKMPKGGIIVFGSLNSKDTPECTKALLKSIGLNHKICRFDFATKYSYLIKK